MNKILLGVLLGAVLGVFDGATAWFTPEVRKDIIGVIIGSTLKGVIAGAAAGIFARKVQSTVAGIVFGLLVGLALAYAVAAMQGKYYFEIMLPGGTVGAILGWATQRYGRPAARRTSAAMAVLAVALFGTGAQAEHAQHAAPTPHAAFAKLKALAGTWDANVMTPDGQKTAITFKVSANGTVVQETLFAGTPHEMITMYTVDGDSVVATHFCAGDNQPTLRLNADESNENQLVFDFVGVRGRNTKTYINGVTMKFGADGKVHEAWRSTGETPELSLYLSGRR